MAAAIQQGRTFRLVTPLKSYQKNITDKKLSGTMCEILLLLDHGYRIKTDICQTQSKDRTIFSFDGNDKTAQQKKTTPFINYMLSTEEDQAQAFTRLSDLIKEREQLALSTASQPFRHFPRPSASQNWRDGNKSPSPEVPVTKTGPSSFNRNFGNNKFKQNPSERHSDNKSDLHQHQNLSSKSWRK